MHKYESKFNFNKTTGMLCIPLLVACIREKTIENFDKCFKYIQVEENHLPETRYVHTGITDALRDEK